MIFTYRVDTKHIDPRLREDILTYNTETGELIGENDGVDNRVASHDRKDGNG